MGLFQWLKNKVRGDVPATMIPTIMVNAELPTCKYGDNQCRAKRGRHTSFGAYECASHALQGIKNREKGRKCGKNTKRKQKRAAPIRLSSITTGR